MSVAKKKDHSMKLVEESDSNSKRPREVIGERRSKELVIAFAGPIGSGIRSVKEKFYELLSVSGYQVQQIKISEYLEKCLINGLVNAPIDKNSDKADRYIRLQDAGNALREIQSDILAEYSIEQIAEIRTEEINSEIENITDYVPVRTAYLIDQLKHQDEVTLLRAVYGNLFYLFGVL